MGGATVRGHRSGRAGECAELGVSELVTNALLHGEPPIPVRVRGTAEHPRIEVRDSSVEAPILPTATATARDRRAAAHLRPRPGHRRARAPTPGARRSRTTARSSGSRRRPSSPTATGVPGVITGVDHSRLRRRRPATGSASRSSACPLAALHRVPAALPRAAPRGAAAGARARDRLPAGQEPVRPVRLAGPAAARRHRRRADRGGRGAGERVDRPGGAHAARDGAPRWPVHRAARPGRRVLPAAAAAVAGPHAEQRRFQNWFLAEFVRQANGEAPLPWLEAASTAAPASSPDLSP